MLDTSEGIIESAQFAASKMGLKNLPYKEWRMFVGPPIQNSFITHFGCTKEKAQEAANIFRAYYAAEALFKAVPYDGIYKLCDHLKCRGIKMAVATFKREDYAVKLLRYFHFDEYCSPMRGADNYNVLTKADIIDLCIREMNEAREDCVLVGDTEYDSLGAIQAGVAFIAVTYGFGFKNLTKANDSNVLGIASHPGEIAEFLTEGVGKRNK